MVSSNAIGKYELYGVRLQLLNKITKKYITSIRYKEQMCSADLFPPQTF